MNVLVAGGAGYIGSHTVKRLKEAGHAPVIYDNLSRGHRTVVDVLKVPAVAADLNDVVTLVETLREHKIDTVMHFAAYAYVGESVEKPLMYYHNNVATTISVLEAMKEAGVSKFVFSSTCAVYGDPERVPITEDEKKAPVSPPRASDTSTSPERMGVSARTTTRRRTSSRSSWGLPPENETTSRSSARTTTRQTGPRYATTSTSRTWGGRTCWRWRPGPGRASLAYTTGATARGSPCARSSRWPAR